MTKPIETTQPELVRLEDAFRWVITWLERAAGVPRSECLGSFPGQARDEERRPDITATGPEYKRWFTTATQPGRGDAPATPGRARVTSIPDHGELAAMLADDAQSSKATTAAEQRCCQAHRLIVEVAMSRVSTSGDCWIFPDDGGEAIRLGLRRALPGTVWRDAKVDYERSQVDAEGTAKETIGAVVTGALVYTDVHLDSRQLGAELSARKPVSAALVIRGDRNEAERFQIIWDGEVTEFRVPLLGQERRLRAFRGLAILLRNPGRHVAYHLINYLAEKAVDTGQQDHDMRERSEELARSVKPIADHLYRFSGSLDEAHRELDAVLHPRFASSSQLARAPWSEHYDPDVIKGQEVDNELYKTVVENAQLSITKSINFIKLRTPHLGAYLKDALVRDPHAIRCVNNPTSVNGPTTTISPAFHAMWRVVDETGVAETRAKETVPQ